MQTVYPHVIQKRGKKKIIIIKIKMLIIQSITILFFLSALFKSQQTFPGNRHAGATAGNHYFVVSVAQAIASTNESHFAKFTSVRKHRMRKEKTGGWDRLSDADQVPPHCWGSHSAGTASRCGSWQTCCVGTGIKMGVARGGQLHDNRIHCDHMNSY